MIPLGDSYERDLDYEPEYEDFAWELENKREFDSCVSYYHESERDIRASTKPDKQLRELSKGRKSLARGLRQENEFNVDDDCLNL